jgi:hypothetical protein
VLGHISHTAEEVTTMTTERHAWASLQEHPPVVSRASATCGCGQDLDTCTGSHCPRCGTSIAAHAA